MKEQIILSSEKVHSVVELLVSVNCLWFTGLNNQCQSPSKHMHLLKLYSSYCRDSYTKCITPTYLQDSPRQQQFLCAKLTSSIFFVSSSKELSTPWRSTASKDGTAARIRMMHPDQDNLSHSRRHSTGNAETQISYVHVQIISLISKTP